MSPIIDIHPSTLTEAPIFEIPSQSTIGRNDDSDRRTMLNAFLKGPLHDAVHAVSDDDYRNVQSIIKNFNPANLLDQVLDTENSLTIQGHAARLYISHPKTNPITAIRILNFASKLIRMGTLLGLEDRYEQCQDDALIELIRSFVNDTSPEIRQEAAEILEDYV